MGNITLTQQQILSETERLKDNTSVLKRKSGLNVLGEIHSLLGRLGESRVEPVAYDTAWIARLGEHDATLAANALSWLRSHQLPDGAWGALAPIYHHDRVVCTLAAIIALQRNGAPEDQARIRAALPALHYSLANLHQDVAGKTVGFEMILPSLVAEARSLGFTIDDPNGIVQRMADLRARKLARAPKGLISRDTTMGFSAEMAGPDGLHLLDLENLLQADGSVSGSPAATAFFVAYVRPQPAALKYLREVVHQGGAPHVTSSDIFEPAWTLWNLTRGLNIDPIVATYTSSLLDRLMSFWHYDRGIAHDSSFSMQDGDDTGIVYELLAQFDRAPDLAAIWHYEEETCFRSFDLESHSSISTNIHILGALRQAGLGVEHPAVQKTANFLSLEQSDQRFWSDKWHMSPYYATSHAIIACTGFLEQVIVGAVDWIVETQNSDGSWGCVVPTAEETAYCLQALMIRHQHGFSIPLEVVERGVAWLLEHSEPPYPPLWIIKTLYCPTPIVRSAILGALRHYEHEFGALP